MISLFQDWGEYCSNEKYHNAVISVDFLTESWQDGEMKFAIVDLANLAFRSFFSTQGDAYDRAGMALHIIFNSLAKLHSENNIDHVVFAIEGKKSWRYRLHEKYKFKRKLDRLAQTPSEKEDAEVFFSVINQLIEYLDKKTCCTVLRNDLIEGDDWLGFWPRVHQSEEYHNVLLSSDSDFIQLVSKNTEIYDGINDRYIRHDGVYNGQGQLLEFTVKPADGKLQIIKEEIRGKKVDKIAPPGWIPESDFPQKALFLKEIRGDVGDNIFSAYPGVRFAGTAKKTGIREAWEDRFNKGFVWNNFMLQTWTETLGTDSNGDPIKKEVRVIDKFHENEILIDLTKQPADIIEIMEQTVLEAVQKEVKMSDIGFSFLKFCATQNLPNLSQNAKKYIDFLKLPYST